MAILNLSLTRVFILTEQYGNNKNKFGNKNYISHKENTNITERNVEGRKNCEK
jgi:hypothetical protein